MTQTTTPPASLSAQEAAEILGVTNFHVHHLVKRGRLRRLPPPEGERRNAIYVRESDVLRYKRERKPFNSGKRFTEADKALLRELWPSHRITQCALALHASRRRTVALAAALGLPPKPVRNRAPSSAGNPARQSSWQPRPALVYCPHLTYTYITVGSAACRACKYYGGQSADGSHICVK